MSDAARWWRWRGDELRLALQVQPRASRDEVIGELDGRLRLRLAAPPVDGAANDRLRSFLAECFDVPPRAVTLLAGSGSRLKRVAVEAPQRFPEWASDARRGRPAR